MIYKLLYKTGMDVEILENVCNTKEEAQAIIKGADPKYQPRYRIIECKEKIPNSWVPWDLRRLLYSFDIEECVVYPEKIEGIYRIEHDRGTFWLDNIG